MWKKIILCFVLAGGGSLADESIPAVQLIPCCGQGVPSGYVIVTCAVPAEVAASISSLPSPAAAEPASEPAPAVQAETVAGEPALRDWESSIYGGFAAKSGNKTSSSYNYGGEFSRDCKVYRGKLNLDGSYSKAEEEVTVSQSEASGELRRMLDGHWFAYGTLSALHDEIKDLSYRMKTGPGLGYYFVDTQELTADVSSGPLYVREKKAGLASGYLAWRFAQGVDWQITDTFRWWVSTEADMDTTDTSAFIVAFKTGVESKINNNLSLLVTVKDSYDSQPEVTGKIEKNDMEISTGLRYTF